MVDERAGKIAEATKVEHYSHGRMPLNKITAIEFLRNIQDVFEMSLDKEDPWVEIYYEDRFGQTQFMRLWMRPMGNHVSKSKH